MIFSKYADINHFYFGFISFKMPYKNLDIKRKRAQKCVDKHEYVKKRKIVDFISDNKMTKYVFTPYILHTQKNLIIQMGDRIAAVADQNTEWREEDEFW